MQSVLCQDTIDSMQSFLSYIFLFFRSLIFPPFYHPNISFLHSISCPFYMHQETLTWEVNLGSMADNPLVLDLDWWPLHSTVESMESSLSTDAILPPWLPGVDDLQEKRLWWSRCSRQTDWFALNLYNTSSRSKTLIFLLSSHFLHFETFCAWKTYWDWQLWS